MSLENNLDSIGLLQEPPPDDEVQQKKKIGDGDDIQDTEKKKNFETFLFDSDGKKYFFVVLYGPN